MNLEGLNLKQFNIGVLQILAHEQGISVSEVIDSLLNKKESVSG
ncbi:hypothetical protein [Prochlorococcus sp. ALOHA_ZT_50]|jgi:hypothetical protein|nr:hypothetical protein [Prochlorococcus sp. ALOHA_ZT_50]